MATTAAPAPTGDSQTLASSSPDTAHHRLNAMEMVLVVLACAVPNPDGFVEAMGAMRKLIETDGDAAKREVYLSTFDRVVNVVKAVQDGRRRAS